MEKTDMDKTSHFLQPQKPLRVGWPKQTRDVLRISLEEKNWQTKKRGKTTRFGPAAFCDHQMGNILGKSNNANVW